jgi:LTXXQ motif family protein
VKSSIAIAALLVASLGLATAVPAIAQSGPASSDGAQIGLGLDANPPAPQAGDQIDLSLGDSANGAQLFDAKSMMPGRAMGPAGMMMLACSPKGAEMLDATLLHLSYRLNLTADQKPLFDTFREKALTTETSFADTCKSDAPATADNAKPDLLARLKSRLTVEQARLTAVNDVLPSFEALYNSLTDTQKAALLPRGGMGGNGMNGPHRWPDDNGAGRSDRPMAPGRG